MGIFEDIKLESQDHPSLTLASPFNILWEYDRGQIGRASCRERV